jgi:peptidoglycan/xylan/chitin deacetylase (PgdA/CDA1 family)
MQEDNNSKAHRKRISRLKKMILAAAIAGITVPVIMCIILGYKLHTARKQIRELEEKYDRLISGDGSTDKDVYSTQKVDVSKRTCIVSDDGMLDSGESISDKNVRKVYLTFDDGPSSNTDRILDILDSYGVKATFFVVGKTDPQYNAVYRRITEDGNTLGMHSYSHDYAKLYASEQSFQDDLSKLQEYLYGVTDVWPRIYRFPGGSSNTVSKVSMGLLIKDLDRQDISYFDWNIDSGDADRPEPGPHRIVMNCLNRVKQYKTAVILLHDASDKNNTVKALPMLIEEIKKLDNTEILPITPDTVPVQHIKD